MATKTIVLITGGNTGIGYESVKALYASPSTHIILMGSRSLDKAHAAIETIRSEVPDSKSEIVPLQIDIEDDTSIENALREVESKYERVDALVNNAGGTFDGIMLENPSAKGIREAWDHTYSLNVTSTDVFTRAFAPLLLKSSQPRLLFVTSGLSSLRTCSDGSIGVLATSVPAGWPKPKTPGALAYRTSKVALNMLMLEWTRLLKADGVAVFCISPGFLATGLGGIGKEKLKQMGAGDASLGGIFIKDVVEGARDDDSGKVVNSAGLQPW
ncbi:NAD(P)-binding protein [Lentithecium fluviatile CBS 122367]|uniref:NAD(P)-binding protein n=1 Tax=Lentithecium fluviatile CBS 122367 TaxID=1168545 RepID=A0A6G1J1T3_9PLEO|nr:NAD(P)-binding protein [Lentithecium fluviatile CBS 122367]